MKQKSGSKKRRKYDASFKAEVLQMVSDGRPAGEVAQALGISENLIYKWKRSKAAGKQAEQLASQGPSAFELLAENERLKTALRKTEQERDILKKALHIDSCWAYLAVWMDLYSRKIVGWSLQGHMREELVIEALRKALGVRTVKKGMILHSDRGGQYAGHAFRGLLHQHQLLQSMSRADDAYDNAFMELASPLSGKSITPHIYLYEYEDGQALHKGLSWYFNLHNEHKPHQALDYKTPAQIYYRKNEASKENTIQKLTL